MNSGYLLAGLGAVGIVAGASMYVTGWHHTIGLGGVGLGVVLLIAGIWASRSTTKKGSVQSSTP